MFNYRYFVELPIMDEDDDTKVAKVLIDPDTVEMISVHPSKADSVRVQTTHGWYRVQMGRAQVCSKLGIKATGSMSRVSSADGSAAEQLILKMRAAGGPPPLPGMWPWPADRK